MDFSLFTEASRDHDAEAEQRREALVRVAVQTEVMPWLALAESDGEYIHRKALIADRLYEIANRHETGISTVERTADRMFRMLDDNRRASLEKAAAMQCANCSHGSVDHSEGLQCGTCGCNNFTPRSKTAAKEARQVTAEGEGGGPFS